MRQIKFFIVHPIYCFLSLELSFFYYLCCCPLGQGVNPFTRKCFESVFVGSPIRVLIIITLLGIGANYFVITKESITWKLFYFVTINKIKFSEVKEYGQFKDSITKKIYIIYFCKRNVSQYEINKYAIEMNDTVKRNTAKLFSGKDGLVAAFRPRLYRYLTEEMGIEFETKVLPRD